MSMKKYLFNIITTTIFIFFLSISFIGLFFGMTSKKDNTEWRKLAEFPKINSRIMVPEFPKLFELYYNDSFGFRNILLSLNATIAIKLFKKSPVANIIRTDRDWYFHNEARYVAPDYKIFYQNIIFSDQQLAALGETFLSDKKFLDQKSIPYLFVIVPDKEVVYPEYYPYPSFINTSIQLSQILKVLNEKGISTLFLGPQLIEAKESVNVPIYIRQDSHWNSLGAFFGYQSVINRLKEYFPNTESLRLSDFDTTINSIERYDLYRLNSLIKTPNDSKEIEMDFKVKDDALYKIHKIDKAIIYSDSFFHGDYPKGYIGGSMYFLKYHFKNMIHVDGILWGSAKQKIEKEHPDIVIREIIQRNLYRFITQPSQAAPAGMDMH